MTFMEFKHSEYDRRETLPTFGILCEEQKIQRLEERNATEAELVNLDYLGEGMYTFCLSKDVKLIESTLDEIEKERREHIQNDDQFAFDMFYFGFEQAEFYYGRAEEHLVFKMCKYKPEEVKEDKRLYNLYLQAQEKYYLNLI